MNLSSPPFGHAGTAAGSVLGFRPALAEPPSQATPKLPSRVLQTHRAPAQLSLFVRPGQR